MPDTEISLLYTYYGQKERVKDIEREKHPKCRLVMVDDCHPDALEPSEHYEVFRVDEDIPWNQPGARNLGFSVLEGWVVCADIDHLVTRGNIDQLLKLKKKKGTIYYLGREDADSWNLYLIHKDDFGKIGGYDEDFCGHYGYDDTLFNLMAQRQLKVEEVRDIKAKVFAKESSTDMERDFRFNQNLLAYKWRKEKNDGERIRFKWHKV